MTLDRVVIIIFLPLLFASGIIEIRRAWEILRYGKKSYPPVVHVRFGLIKLFQGHDGLKRYKDRLERRRNWRLWGVNSLVYGISVIIGCVLILIYIL